MFAGGYDVKTEVAPRHGKWGPVKPGFWDIWHANKEPLQKNGYSVRKSESGEWEVRFIPGTKMGWPPTPKPDPIVVPSGMKASLCLKCGHVKLITADDEQRACTLCGGKIDSG